MRVKISLVGERFRQLVVLAEHERVGSHSRWRCLCDCGRERIVWQHQLKSGQARACQACMLPEMVGNTFGRWIVLEQVARPGRKTGRWFRCLCDCGQEGIVRGDQLRNGTSRSCGCLSSEIHADLARRLRLTHGGRKSPEYQVWIQMLQRCKNPRNRNYKNYGGRGITVCERWRDFSAFMEDMGSRPHAGLTIERKDNNRGYTAENCIWGTREEQANNSRHNRLITFNNQTLTVSQWAALLGMKSTVIINRLRIGWPEELALTTPIRAGNRLATIKRQAKH